MNEKNNKNSETYAFCVLTYNQENLIIECLESIKYQIVNYAKPKYEISLIIVDDASTDNTQNNINKWLNINGDLFTNIDFHIKNKNKGLVDGFCYIAKNAKQNHFKIIAGDDVFSSQNIFEMLNTINTNEFFVGAILTLQQGRINIRKWDLKRFVYYKRRTKKIKKPHKILYSHCCIPAIECIHTKELFKYIDLDHIKSNYKYIEDYCTWYYYFKNCKKLKFRYELKTPILYRINSNSIFNTRTEEYFQDLINIKQEMLKDANPIAKLSILNEIRHYKNRQNITNKYLDIKTYILKLMDMPWLKKEYDRCYNTLKSRIAEEQKYYNDIKQNAVEFLKDE